MSGAHILAGAREAVAWTKATRGGLDLPSAADRRFLEALSDLRVATSRDIGCVVDRKEDRARQRCRRLGWAEFVRPKHGVSGWVLTETGRVVRDTRVHKPGQGA